MRRCATSSTANPGTCCAGSPGKRKPRRPNDWKRGRLLTATDTRSNNGTRGTPSLVADVVGDWLMHDPQYPGGDSPAEHHLQPAVLRGLLSGLGHGLR
ncbi:hypothetical protein [Pseudarthrobacter sp. Y6]|uniref:rhamnogalacturonan lyase family protein n=1 Tax=Pseudarthrobacter sp. Y6 TaxID=3418422 RepID=UPI003CF5D54F